jgi:hypothetical protein
MKKMVEGKLKVGSRLLIVRPDFTMICRVENVTRTQEVNPLRPYSTMIIDEAAYEAGVKKGEAND